MDDARSRSSAVCNCKVDVPVRFTHQFPRLSAKIHAVFSSLNGFRLKVPGQSGFGNQRGIIRAEVSHNLLEWHVGKGAAVKDIFHVAIAGAIELLKERIAMSVKFKHMNPEPVAERCVEGGSGLHPSALDAEIGIGVPEENIGSQ